MTLSEMKTKSCFELFCDFFQGQTGQELTEEQRNLVLEIADNQEVH